MNQELTPIHLPFHDAYTLRRAFSRMDITDCYMSPALQLFISSYGDLAQDTNYARLSASLATRQDVIQQIMPIDPTIAQDYLEEAVKFINANDLKNLTIPRYLLSDYPFYEYAMNALVGASGGGKSFIALDFAAKVASRIDTGNVGYIAGEGLNGYASRWEAWCKHYGERSDRLIFYPDVVNFMDDEAVTMFIQRAEREHVRLLIVDTVARCMIGGDENSTKDMGIFVSQIDRTRRALNCGVLLVHHTGKDGTMRGSSALYAACDSVVFLTRNEDVVTIHNEHDKGGKNKYQKELASRSFRFMSVQVTIKDQPAESAVLVETALVDDMPNQPLSTNKKMILKALEAYTDGLPAKEIMKATNLAQSNLYYNLKTLIKDELLNRIDDNYIVTEKGMSALNAL
jgi:hypothetical protein